MELDFSEKWRIIPAPTGGSGGDPAEFAAEELAAVLGRMGCRLPAPGDAGDTERILILNSGSGGSRGRRRFSWRASPDRVEIYGSDGGALLGGAYDFLGALGARWPAPGAERLPSGPLLRLEGASRSSKEEAIDAVLALGHGAFLEAWEDYLPWAARAGYRSILLRVTRSLLSLEGSPETLYESLRVGLAALARKLGLSLELALDPGMDTGHLAEFAAAHPEVSVFHLWPESPWNFASGAAAAAGSPAPRAKALLEKARDLAAALTRARPGASLSIHASEDDEELPAALAAGEPLPPGLGLLWAPRRRSWGAALGDPASPLNAASLALYRNIAAAWRRSGGGRILALERYEDAFLFKGAAPPFPALIEGDVAAYRGGAREERADAVGLLCGGGRLPLGLRPNPAILAALAADPGLEAEAAFNDWAEAAYGATAPALRGYWRELEAAWAIDLDLAEGETELRVPQSLALAVAQPPRDWGDPWKAGAERLSARRGRCEELFDHLRRAEARLAEARALDIPEEAPARRAGAETDEYAISGSILELDCARLSSYHELASGDAHAAADIANLALSASAALRKALARVPDPRARRETRLVVSLFYELALRELRRFNARSAIRRILGLWLSRARIALESRAARSAYQPKPGREADSREGNLAQAGMRRYVSQ